MKVNTQLQQVTFPPISEVKGWIAQRQFPADKPLLDLCQAIPDYPPHPQLLEHLKHQLSDPTLAVYSPDEGLLEVRNSVSRWYKRRYGLDAAGGDDADAGPRPEQICLTIGASQAFWLALLLVCRAGDEVIVQVPAYFDHPMALQTLGIVPRYVAVDTVGALPDVEAIAAAITPRTRAILLVTPSNPTGAITPPALLEQLYQLAVEQDIALILDETYNAFVPGQLPPHALFAKPDWPRHLIHLASFGKTFALTGFRAGALVADQALIYQALKVQDSMVVCQPRITQRAVAYGCDHLDAWVADNAAMMQRRHDQFVQLFNASVRSFELAASGAFFAWVRHPWKELTGRQAARRLADEANLICLPGEVFGPGLEGYLRLAFGNIRLEQIETAVARFAVQ
ncbi:MAG: aminotransferase [Desulfuromonadaceae bacterium]|nr:aminotransferase [Desulfuromonadaceae bacterium]